ncbi:hypothetical protein M0R04_02245 [Candidatus Dojkabacteria bacterium]|jgi:hypothetical protein|nr:hypothetical protein [Candidatus Dojkabacteria bacterium]
MDSRGVKRFKAKFGKFLDPFGIFLLIALFLLPALAITNLSPHASITKNVLGVESKPGIGVVLVGGTHSFITNENISFPTDGKTVYQAEMIKRDTGIYSKPILQINNKSDKQDTIIVNGGTTNPTGSPIYLVYRNQTYLIQDTSGNRIFQDIKIEGSEKDIMYLKFDTKMKTNANEEIEIEIVRK